MEKSPFSKEKNVKEITTEHKKLEEIPMPMMWKPERVETTIVAQPKKTYPPATGGIVDNSWVVAQLSFLS